MALLHTILSFLNIQHVLITIGNYPLSTIEFLGVTTGLLGLYLATREKTINWLINLISILCFFAIFYQVNLYAEMFFQIYFLLIGIYGWISWHKEDNGHTSSLTYLKNSTRLWLILLLVASTAVLSKLMLELNFWWPTLFTQKDPYPITDSFIAIGSIMAMTLLAKKKIENWGLWMLVNLISVLLYAKQGIFFAAFEYTVFFAMVTIGFFAWQKKYKARQHI